MIEKILDLSVRNRWFIVLLTAVACALGVWSLNKLPIDAVPDITNNQVQINAVAPALSPIEIEKQVTFPIETSWPVPRASNTRARSPATASAQVTAVFRDDARHLLRAPAGERAPGEANPAIAAARGRAKHGSDLDRPRRDLHVDRSSTSSRNGRAGCRRQTGLAERRQLPHAGRRAPAQRSRARRLSAHGAGLDHPPAAAGRCRASPASTAIGGYVKQYHVQPDPMKLVAYGLSFARRHRGAGDATTSAAAPAIIEHNGEIYVVRAAGRIEIRRARSRDDRRRHARRHADPRAATSPRCRHRRASCAPAAPARTARRSWSARR